MKTRIILGAAAAFVLAACEPDNQATTGGNATAVGNEALPGGGAARQVAAGQLAVATSDDYGQYLVDGEGRALYVLEGSRQQAGQAQQPAQGQQASQPQAQGQTAQCAAECHAEWPPYVTQGAPAAGQGIDAGLISTTATMQNAQQVTYAGWPLFYYSGDRDPGSTSGQELDDSWGSWYLLAPSGERIEGREMGPSAE